MFKKIFTTLVPALLAMHSSPSLAQDTKKAMARLEALDLKSYGRMKAKERNAILAAILQADDLEAHLPDFINCMGEFAHTKRLDLNAARVFSWCQSEQEANPEQFVSHFNFLDEPDHSTMAAVACRNTIRDFGLANGLTNFKFKFPWVPDYSFNRGHHRYEIRSHVSLEDPFGGSERLEYACTAVYDGSGDTLLQSSWQFETLEFYQN